MDPRHPPDHDDQPASTAIGRFSAGAIHADRVVSIDTGTDMAIVALGEVKREVSLALVEDVRIDDYVLIHVGYALNKVSEEEAEKTLALMAEAGLLDGDGNPAEPELVP